MLKKKESFDVQPTFLNRNTTLINNSVLVEEFALPLDIHTSLFVDFDCLPDPSTFTPL